jgi:hypothetical protein
MKAHTISIQLALIVFATAALAESPATLICDGFERSSASDQAQAFIRFSQSIDSRFSKIDPKDEACVITRLDSLEATRSTYCESRSNLGHDLAAHPLERLTSKLFSVSSDCAGPRRDAEITLLKEMLPDTCDQLLSSFLKYVAYRELMADWDEGSIECNRATVPEHSTSLTRACEDGALSLDAAYVELGARVSAACDSEEGS